jgi:hypothetical protein
MLLVQHMASQYLRQKVLLMVMFSCRAAPNSYLDQPVLSRLQGWREAVCQCFLLQTINWRTEIVEGYEKYAVTR